MSSRLIVQALPPCCCFWISVGLFPTSAEGGRAAPYELLEACAKRLQNWSPKAMLIASTAFGKAEAQQNDRKTNKQKKIERRKEDCLSAKLVLGFLKEN